MWTRKELKTKAKEVVKLNYWKCVLASIVLAIAIGGLNTSLDVDTDDFDQARRIQKELNENGSLVGKTTDETDKILDGIDQIKENVEEQIQKDVESDDEMPVAAVVFLILVIGIAVCVIIVIVGSVSIFLLNPLQIGGRRFFVVNLNEQAQPKELGHGFTEQYMRNVKAMFLADLKIFLWGLLFIIPGIVKHFEYMMVPYLLAMDNEITPKEALEKSSEMMKGQKWNAFVLKLSFLGWDILSILTCGMLSIFYVNPYQFQTEAALFEALNGGSTPALEMDGEEYETYIEM